MASPGNLLLRELVDIESIWNHETLCQLALTVAPSGAGSRGDLNLVTNPTHHLCYLFCQIPNTKIISFYMVSPPICYRSCHVVSTAVSTAFSQQSYMCFHLCCNGVPWEPGGRWAGRMRSLPSGICGLQSRTNTAKYFYRYAPGLAYMMLRFTS